MRIARVSRAKRAALALLGLGGLALLLSACTLTATTTTVIPGGTSTQQTVGTMTVKYSPSDSTFQTKSLYISFSIRTGSGTVALTPATSISPTVTGTVTANGLCHPTAPTELVCPGVSHGLGTGTVTISGLKVNSTNASGKLIASVQTTDDPFSSVTRTVVVAQYTTGSPAVVLVAPTFHSPASAEFVAGKLGAKWVRVQGPAVLSLIGAPAWLSISPHAGYLHGTPPANSAGTYKFTILASTDPHTKRVHGSDNLTAKQAFTLTVVKP